MAKKSGLGKGLSALIPAHKRMDESKDRYEEIDITLLDPNPEQPRQVFDKSHLQELSDSIKHNGVIQPLIVTPQGERFIIIAGERRWRASKLAGYKVVPAIVRKIEKGKMLSLALLENIQRQELNPIEEALAYSKLLEDNNFTHETLAVKMGKNRTTISNTVRLLKLPEAIKDKIQDGLLSFGHARCLITVDANEHLDKLADKCIQGQWSVRELEKRIALQRSRATRRRSRKQKNIKDIELQISQIFGSKVTIAGEGRKGKITIAYESDAQFKKILSSLMLGNEPSREGDVVL